MYHIPLYNAFVLSLLTMRPTGYSSIQEQEDQGKFEYSRYFHGSDFKILHCKNEAIA